MFKSHSTIYALALLAHPDDEAFLLAGTSLKFAEEGKQMLVVCATKGEKGTDRLKRNLTENEMAKIRVSELMQACSILKCRCADYFKYPDGGLASINYENLVQELVEQIDLHKPQIILTFGPEGVTGHRDHVVIGKAAIEAAKSAKHKVQEIWLASMPASNIQTYNQHMATQRVHHSHYQYDQLTGVPDDQLLKIDIEKYRDQKHQALQAHQSQYLPQFYLDIFQKFEYFEVKKIS